MLGSDTDTSSLRKTTDGNDTNTTAALADMASATGATAAGGYGSGAYYDAGEYDQAVAVNAPAPAVPYSSPTAAAAVAAAGNGQSPQHETAATTTTTTTGRGGYQGAHPIAALFHIVFKAAALLTFLLGGVLSSSYVLIFILTILFVAADFWTTKNVTGRLMVCLRWWNEVREDGTTRWVFESSPAADDSVNRYDRWFFWTVLAGYSALWLLFCVFNLMSVTRLPIALIGLVLAATNLLGYVKCQRDARGRVTQYMLSRAAAVHFGLGSSSSNSSS